jgi:Zn-dependent protease
MMSPSTFFSRTGFDRAGKLNEAMGPRPFCPPVVRQPKRAPAMIRGNRRRIAGLHLRHCIDLISIIIFRRVCPRKWRGKYVRGAPLDARPWGGYVVRDAAAGERAARGERTVLGYSLPQILLIVAVVVISLTVHEFAHSLAAIALGDDTPKRDGRLTLNPLVHIDLIGFLLLVFVGFGWAKPVRIDTSKLTRPRRDEIIISMAGPASNMLFAVLVVLLLKLFVTIGFPHSITMMEKLADVVAATAAVNVGLALFNILPIPPLDGSHFITSWLMAKNTALVVAIFRYGSLALLALVIIQVVAGIDVIPIRRLTLAIIRGMYGLVGLS